MMKPAERRRRRREGIYSVIGPIKRPHVCASCPIRSTGWNYFLVCHRNLDKASEELHSWSGPANKSRECIWTSVPKKKNIYLPVYIEMKKKTKKKETDKMIESKNIDRKGKKRETIHVYTFPVQMYEETKFSLWKDQYENWNLSPKK